MEPAWDEQDSVALGEKPGRCNDPEFIGLLLFKARVAGVGVGDYRECSLRISPHTPFDGGFDVVFYVARELTRDVCSHGALVKLSEATSGFFELRNFW